MVFSIFYLDAGARLHFAQAADERPAAGRDVGDFGDGLHPLGTGDAHLQDRMFVTANSALRAQPRGLAGAAQDAGSGTCAYLGYPQGTADVGPLGACSCCLHGAALLRTQKALGADAEDARPAQPVPQRHFDDAVTGLQKREGL